MFLSREVVISSVNATLSLLWVIKRINHHAKRDVQTRSIQSKNFAVGELWRPVAVLS